MNLRQSEGIRGILAHAGFEMVDDLKRADIVIFNGCMVRQKAEEKVYGRIGAVVEEKRKRPILLGIGGCLGQIHGATLLERIHAIDFVFGSGGHATLPDLIERARAERTAELAPSTFESEVHARRTSTVSGMVTITEGCSNFCAYCIVPFARGPMRSRPRSLILAETEALHASGYKEVLLLGQNVNAYGTDRPEFGSFADLLSEVAQSGIRRIRFTSSHPKDMSDDILRIMQRDERVCPHLHLACQSGSDDVLAAMRRGYDRAHFLRLVDRARTRVPDLNLSTDLIVGFPGETDDDFEQTMDLVEQVRFGTIFAAKYSPRPGTKAAQRADDVCLRAKEIRLARLLDRQRAIAREENERFVGRDVEVLLENAGRDGVWIGRTRDHRTVMCRGDANIGDMATVRVDGASAASLSGGILVRERLGGLT
jgi:tRNA-2-methylthio-N6-dimethylallyladenosine synthase